jgi:pantetheine-phosphate adenylyltransferase
VFLMASETNQFIASKLVKEIAYLAGDVSKFVSANVTVQIETKLADRRIAKFGS